MTCIMTGAVCYFHEYDAWARGDMYMVNGSYVLYANPREFGKPDRADYYCAMRNSFYKETKPYEVYVFGTGSIELASRRAGEVAET